MHVAHRRTVTAAFALVLVVAIAGTAGAVGAKTRLASRNDGVPGDGDCESSALSACGRFVAFQSYADNFPRSSAVVPRIYLVDTATGRIRLVAKNSAGAPADAGSYAASISNSGRFVAFRSAGSNLPAGDGATSHIYVHDRKSGKTRLVSKTSAGEPADSSSGPPSISGNGRYVAFSSMADNLPRGDGILNQVFIHDRKTRTTKLIARTASDVPDGHSQSPSLSGNGRIVAFESRSTHLPQGDGSAMMYAYDRSTRQVHLVSATSQGLAADGASFGAIVSADGRVVTFSSRSSNLPGGDGVLDQVYAHVLATGKTRVLSVITGGGPGDGNSHSSDVSGTGRFVVFQSQSDNLPGGDGTRVHVYIHDRRRGTTKLLSRSSAGAAGNANSFTPQISADARFTSFESYASHFPGGGGSMLQIYVRGPVT
jgi:Tol biopolymer transport system component